MSSLSVIFLECKEREIGDFLFFVFRLGFVSVCEGSKEMWVCCHGTNKRIDCIQA